MKAEFKFDEYNPRRAFTGKEATRVFIKYENEDEWAWLWMSEKDIRHNIMIFGQHPELLKALEHCQKKIEIRDQFNAQETYRAIPKINSAISG